MISNHKENSQYTNKYERDLFNRSEIQKHKIVFIKTKHGRGEGPWLKLELPMCASPVGPQAQRCKLRNC